MYSLIFESSERTQAFIISSLFLRVYSYITVIRNSRKTASFQCKSRWTFRSWFDLHNNASTFDHSAWLRRLFMHSRVKENLRKIWCWAMMKSNLRLTHDESICWSMIIEIWFIKWWDEFRLMQKIWSNENERDDWLNRRRKTTSHLLMKTAMQKTKNMHTRIVRSIAEYWRRESYYNDEIQIILINQSETSDMLTIEMKCLTFWNDERKWNCSCEYIIVSKSRIFIIICLQQFKLQSFSNYQLWLKWKYDTTRYCDFFNNREYNRTFC